VSKECRHAITGAPPILCALNPNEHEMAQWFDLSGKFVCIGCGTPLAAIGVEPTEKLKEAVKRYTKQNPNP